jgi:hypothetical protein
MVHLRTVPGVFHARVIAARLGADGILTELRGAHEGPYPFGSVSIWVTPDDETVAAELLLADEVEAAFDDPAEVWEPEHPRRILLWGCDARRLAAALALIVLLGVTLVGRMFG